MALIVSLALLILALISYRRVYSWLFPPALYALYWAGIIASSTFLAFGKNHLTARSLLVFVSGCLMFATGGYIAWFLFRNKDLVRPTSPKRKRIIQTVIAVYGLGLTATIPLFIETVQETASSLGIAQFAVAARAALALPDRGGIPRYFLSLTSLGSVLSYYAAWIYDKTPRDKLVLVLAVLGSLAMNALTFARTPVFALMISVMSILYFRKKIGKKIVLLLVAMTLGLTLIMGTMLDKGPDLEARSPIIAIAENLGIYFVGGPIGFARAMEAPTLVGERGLSLRFFTQFFYSLGFDISLPNNVLGYITAELGNVYTAYFAYWLDWGWAGIVVFASLAGFISTTVYSLARKGHPVAGTALGLVVGAILTSAVGDGLFGSAVPWLLLLGVGWLLWHLPVPKEAQIIERNCYQETALARRPIVKTGRR